MAQSTTSPVPDTRVVTSVVRGDHRFRDADLARIAAGHGRDAAWRIGFERFGPDVVHKVEGDFSVHLEDSHGRQFAAVDRFGIPPLCFRIDDGRMVGAERANAVAKANARISAQAIFDYLFFHVIPAPRTIFEDVARLPAGHSIVSAGREPTIERWWRPVFVEDERAPFEDLREEFKRLLRQSVSRRLGGRSGCFLSGGTDSSTVAGLVTELSGRPAKTYSIGFDAEGYDEMEYARIAARHFGTDHHEYYVTADDVARSISSLCASYDQPFGNSSVLPAYYCAKMAREDATELLLAGDGGDELFGGNTRYAKQRVLEAYGRLPRLLREGLLEPVFTASFPARVPGLRKVSSYVEQARVPMPARTEMYNLLHRIGLAEIFSPAFLAVIDSDEPFRQQRDVYAECSSPALTNRMLAFDWKYTLADNDLPKVAGATAYAGVPVSFPFLDDELVDFSLRLPAEFKVRGTKLRWFFKEALRDFLPEPILKKKKHGFGLPFGVWVTRHTPLHELAVDTLQRFARRRIVKAEFIERLTSEYLPKHPGYYGEMVWLLMVLELWFSAHGTPGA